MTYYGQKNYNELIGGGNGGLPAKYTIAQVGCFLTAFCNLLARLGEPIDPPALNTYFIQHHVYGDTGDGVKDDLGYGAVSAKDPSITLASTGTKGWPTSNNAIVKFLFRPAGKSTAITHFCLVADAKKHTIVDSWDGVTKYPGAYGNPVAWATYVKAAPERVDPVVVKPKPIPVVHKPVETVEKPAATAPATYDVVTKITGYYTSNDAANHLTDRDPSGPVEPGVYHIFAQAHGMVNVTRVPGTPGSWINPADNKVEEPKAPAPETVPVSEVVPAPAPTPAAPAVVYAKFDAPMALVTNKDTHSFNFVSGAEVAALPAGAPFEAVGKATLANGDVYYMDENSFGAADQTQKTPITVGIKTVDLAPAPNTAPVDTPAEAPATPASAPAAPISAELPAGVTEYQLFMNPQQYAIQADMTIPDISGKLPGLKRAAGTPVKVGAKFNYNGHPYWRAQSSIDNGTWYAFPATSLRKLSGDAAVDGMDVGDAALDGLIAETEQMAEVENRVTHPNAIRWAATLEGLIARILKALHISK